MLHNNSSIYSIKNQTRSIEAVIGDAERQCFFVGTASVGKNNEVHLLEYTESQNELIGRVIYKLENEIEQLAPHPTDSSLLLSCQYQGTMYVNLIHFNYFYIGRDSLATLCKMHKINEIQDEIGVEGNMEELAKIRIPKEIIKRVLWAHSGTPENSFAVLTGQKVHVYDIEVTSGENEAKENVLIDDQSIISNGTWNPHRPKEIALAFGSSVATWDMRTKEKTHHIQNAHALDVHGIDYNPNKPYHIVTGGDDRSMRFWDLRNTKSPLKCHSGHSHWIWDVKYNRFHDQLLLSAGSDSMVNLWRISSISSAPLLEFEETEDENTNVADILVKKFQDHEDSVYSVSWASSDSWLFASLSYDGRVVVNHVPSSEKYKILL